MKWGRKAMGEERKEEAGAEVGGKIIGKANQ
jgi:hypothetical protein